VPNSCPINVPEQWRTTTAWRPNSLYGYCLRILSTAGDKVDQGPRRPSNVLLVRWPKSGVPSSWPDRGGLRRRDRPRHHAAALLYNESGHLSPTSAAEVGVRQLPNLRSSRQLVPTKSLVRADLIRHQNRRLDHFTGAHEGESGRGSAARGEPEVQRHCVLRSEGWPPALKYVISYNAASHGTGRPHRARLPIYLSRLGGGADSRGARSCRSGVGAVHFWTRNATRTVTPCQIGTPKCFNLSRFAGGGTT
jgi:hypothetical protein